MEAVTADYFDGRSARPHRVRVTIAGDRLRIEDERIGRTPIDSEPIDYERSDGERVDSQRIGCEGTDGGGTDGAHIDRTVPLTEVRWPERQRHGAQVVELADGSSLHPLAGQSWRALRDRATGPESLVVRAQQSWRGVGAALVAFIVVLVAGWIWGVPLAARLLVAAVPLEADQAIGQRMTASFDGEVFGPSKLPAAEQEAIAAALAAAVGRAWPAGDGPTYQLRFVDGRKVGPNALALPGGTIYLTDQLVALVKEAEAAGRADTLAMLVGVLAHELGHVDQRHGMRSAAQAMLVGLAAGLVFGDLSSVVAAIPVVLIQQGYSRDFEREADAESARILRAAGMSPVAMAAFFEQLVVHREKTRGGRTGPAIGLGSHPPDQERIEYFRNATR